MSKEHPTPILSCLLPNVRSEIIRLGHGSGGKMTANLIESVFLPLLGNEALNQLEDSATLSLHGGRLAFTTDSYVVSPIIFPGGDIGSLAVYGTVNDLSMRGARPLCLSASFILEEGLPIAELAQIVSSMQEACKRCGVNIVTADTKVVNKGAADKVFITTSGIGVIESEQVPSAGAAQPGDCIIVSGDIGRHGIAVMSSREGLELETAIISDSCPLFEAVQSLVKSEPEAIHCLRDITRGGLASVLNELASASSVGIAINEEAIPVNNEVRAVCEILGLDPLYVACEGRFISIVSAESTDRLLTLLRKHDACQNAAIIGRVVSDHAGRVVMRSIVGGNRIVDKLSGEQLPRIC